MMMMDIDSEQTEQSEKQRITTELMRDRMSDWADKRTIKVFCGTWNVNGRVFEPERFSDLNMFISKNVSQHDLVVIGLQEIVALNARNVMIDGSKTEERFAYWQSAIHQCLASTGESFTLKACSALVGIALYVFAKDSIAASMYDIRTSVAGVGVLGLMGNKGGVTIAFRLYDSNMCFVCAHLAPRRGNIEARAQNYSAILSKTALLATGRMPDLNSWHNNAHPKFFAEDLSILDYDTVFWLGDLNYHIDESVSTEDVFQLAAANKLELLRSRDQLTLERLARRVFGGFLEAPLTFCPTYKYVPGTNEYETRTDKKLRAPAWCDRVLWYTMNSRETVRVIEYDRSDIHLSDHKPVYASFQVDVQQVSKRKEREVFAVVATLMDRFENESKPRIEIVDKFIDLGVNAIGSLATASLVVQNIGTSIAYWSLVNDKNSKLVYSDWLLCVPNGGILMPNQSVEIKLTAHLKAKHLLSDSKSVSNSTTRQLEEILIVRVKGGGDLFCVVTTSVPLEAESFKSAEDDAEGDAETADDELDV